MYDTVFVENMARIITLISYSFLFKLAENMVMFLSVKIVSVMEMVAYWMRQLIVSSHANHRFLKVFCWKRIIQKCKWFSIRDNTFYLDKNENTFAGNECQR